MIKMKIKIKITTLLFIILLSVTAFAQEDTYIVRFNDSMQLFSANEKQGINYTVATQEELQEYIEAGIVEHYEPNYEVFAIETNAEEVEETLPEVKPNWNFDMVNAAFAYNLGAMGNEVKVAVIDSGLHSDDMLKPQILDGYDFIENRKTYDDVNNDNADGDYHGTLVSSIIARQNIGYGTGIAARAHIMPLRVLKYDPVEKNNMGNLDDIIAAIEYATKAGCDVINMSLGIRGSEILEENLSTLSIAIQKAVDKGIIVIAAAGNDGASEYMYPASLDNVISVASVESDRTRSNFSQYNNKVDISAPGGLMQIGINYRVENGGGIVDIYQKNGTSLAAPHVSGLAAVAKCIKPEINDTAFREVLQKTSGQTERNDELGYGIIDCQAAIKELLKGKTAYLSPATFVKGTEGNYTGTMTLATLYNNDEKNTLNATVFYSLYNPDKTLEKVIKYSVSLSPGKKENFMKPYSGGNVKYMVWENLKSMVPLTPSSYK